MRDDTSAMRVFIQPWFRILVFFLPEKHPRTAHKHIQGPQDGDHTTTAPQPQLSTKYLNQIIFSSSS